MIGKYYFYVKGIILVYVANYDEVNHSSLPDISSFLHIWTKKIKHDFSTSCAW